MTTTHIGELLYQQGWRQGSIFPATSAPIPTLLYKAGGQESTEGGDLTGVLPTWGIPHEPLAEEEFFVVASHTCDIKKAPENEPCIEVVRAFWTADKGDIHEARKSSINKFLLQMQGNAGGPQKGLVADATRRTLVKKETLLEFAPESGFLAGDTDTPYRFGKWLAIRYERQALDDHLVLVIQKPLVKAASRLSDSNDLHRIIDGFDIRFLLQNNEVPYQILMIFIPDERWATSPVTWEDASSLAEWVDEVLQKNGEACLADWDLATSKQISIYDYKNSYGLSFDRYSLADELSDTGPFPQNNSGAA